MPGKGNAISMAEKEIVVNIKLYFDNEKKSHPQDRHLALKSSVALTALATQLSEISVKRIVAEHNKGKLSPPLPKGSNPHAIHEGVKTICQDIIRSHNIRREHLSIRLLVGILNDKHKIDVARETLRAYLYRWEILYGSVQRHTALRERDYVVKARRAYLIRKRELNKSNRTIKNLPGYYSFT